jgi:cyclopropane fatty-acyl-phospholipid synthase-like methyltransferase
MKYADYYKQMHNEKQFRGWVSKESTNYGEKNMNHIYGAMQATRSKTVLDFGCGTSEQYSKGNVHRKMGVKQENLYLYDPGVEKFNKRPDVIVDATISFDVFEHIPREELPEVFEYIFSHTRNFCYFVIFCGLASKTLPNGENAHCTIMSQDSWRRFIEQYNTKDIPILYSFRIPVDPKYNILNL